MATIEAARLLFPGQYLPIRPDDPRPLYPRQRPMRPSAVTSRGADSDQAANLTNGFAVAFVPSLQEISWRPKTIHRAVLRSRPATLLSITCCGGAGSCALRVSQSAVLHGDVAHNLSFAPCRLPKRIAKALARLQSPNREATLLAEAAKTCTL